jgi:hypothetical protein
VASCCDHGDRLVCALLQGIDHLLYLASGFMGPCGQLAHLIGHDCKSATLFTGPGRFNRRVQGQQVGLFRDARNDIQYPADALALRFHRLNRMLCNRHFLSPFTDGIRCLLHQRAAVLRLPVRHIRGFVRGCGIASHVMNACGHLGHRLDHRFGGTGGLSDQVANLLGQLVETVGQLTQFPRPCRVQWLVQITLSLSDMGDRGSCLTQGGKQPPGGQPAECEP